LGGDESLHADVRVIAATNVNISEALESGKLRRDLYYRLNAFTLRLPPLRSRKDEIPLLLEHFIRRFAADYEREVTPPSRRLTAACMEYPWPGNIRELQNFVQRLLIQGDEEEALKELQRYNYSTAEERAPVELNKGKEATPIDLKELGRQLKSRTERPTIEKALQKTRYNRKAAAQHLKISYKSLLLKLREYGLDGKHPLGGPDLAIEA
jgi:DNA-binding NtrC family response regulator